MSWPEHLPVSVIIALGASHQPPAVVLQIIEGYAPVKVAYAVHGEAVRARRIYLSPPGKNLIVGTGGVLLLDDGNAFDMVKPSVNRLFAAAAAIYGQRVIGIVLSGNSADGAQGLLDIEAAGGVGIVQDPKDAAAERMPKHALRGDHPHYCVKAAEMAGLVQELSEEPL
ncbi:chemotaxis protein CheB [Variovorax sp. KK3]|uniref:chemotaxis protein CheB n=1 Tax=Variovorax sp. KK3 TaxID=1855728 RepID=UPI003AAE3377